MKRIVFTILIVVAAVLAVTIYFRFDPAETSNLFPKCLFVTFTGYQCPGCGTQRAIHCLLHGDMAGVIHYNAALVVAVPVILLYAFAEWRRTSCVRLYRVLNSTVAIIIVAVAIVAWWILRNVLGV